MPHVWCLLSLFPLIGSKGHRKHNDVQRPLIRCDKHNHIKNAQKSWEVQSCTPKIFGVHGLSNQGLAKKEKIQHLWKYGSLHMDVTCTSMKASLMLDDKNILWCNIDREAHLKECEFPCVCIMKISVQNAAARLLTKQSCTGSPCIKEYTKCESVCI